VKGAFSLAKAAFPAKSPEYTRACSLTESSREIGHNSVVL
jgi:hypothetical protein